MATEKVQNFENHTRKVPVFIMGILILFANLLLNLYRLRYGITAGSVMSVLVGAALIALFVFGRNSTLAVQNRVIRLEMRLRLARLLPLDVQHRVPEFTLDQLVGMRFASDEELPTLARKVLDEKLTERKTIKQLVKNWEADYLRA